ncbi:hypothetical protein BHM03_00002714 [Ensete ventricosum]|nr:hypothetical protein BHM03_00002714 [Ensete ventricosum]
MTNCRNGRLGYGRESFRPQRHRKPPLVSSPSSVDVGLLAFVEVGCSLARCSEKSHPGRPQDIIRGSPDVKWESIKGLDNAKRLLKEAVVMPIKYPKYFTGLLSPWKGILLFGPPGTGKVCAVSSIRRREKRDFDLLIGISSLAGDSEKLVRVLFELARHHAPATIFLDEIDAIISQRGEARSEHEASRRLKTELLIQVINRSIDGWREGSLATLDVSWSREMCRS